MSELEAMTDTPQTEEPEIMQHPPSTIDHFYVNNVMRELGFGWYEKVKPEKGYDGHTYNSRVYYWENALGFKYTQDQAADLVMRVDAFIQARELEIRIDELKRLIPKNTWLSGPLAVFVKEANNRLAELESKKKGK